MHRSQDKGCTEQLPFPMHEVDVVLGGEGQEWVPRALPRSSAGWGQMETAGLALPLGGTPRSKLGPRATTEIKEQLNWAPAPARLWARASVLPQNHVKNHGKGLPPAPLWMGN